MFDRNQTYFPTFIHRALFYRANFLRTPEISLAGINDEKTKSAYMDLYHFLYDFYVDIYKNPQDYHLDTFGLEDLCKGKNWGIVKINAGWRKDNATIEKLDEIDISIFPWRFVWEILSKFHLENNKAVFEKDIFNKLIKRFQKKCYPKPYLNTICKFLERNGIIAEETENNFVLSSRKHPAIFVVLKQWNDLLEKTNKTNKRYLYHSAFHHLDYRAFLPDWKISFEDVLYGFDDKTRDFIKEINDFMVSMKINCKIEREWSLEYKFKGKSLLNFNIADDRPFFRIPMFNVFSEEYKLFESKIESLPNKDKIKSFCKKNAKRCRLCGCHPVPASMLGCWIEVFGKKIKICGGSPFYGTSLLTKDSLEILKDLIKIRYDILKGIKAN